MSEHKPQNLGELRLLMYERMQYLHRQADDASHPGERQQLRTAALEVKLWLSDFDGLLYGSDTSPSGDGGEPGFINRFLDEAHVVAGIGIMPSEAVRVLKAEIGDGRGTPREDG